MPTVLTRLTRRRHLLYVPARLLATALTEGWSKWPMETGGIILGRPTTDGHIVTDLIGPGPGAQHARYGFVPDSDWQAQQVADCWSVNPAITYLGDWHTHPGGTTRLSRLDRGTVRDIAAYEEARQPSPYMLVMAMGQDQSDKIGASRLQSGRFRRVGVLPASETSLP